MHFHAGIDGLGIGESNCIEIIACTKNKIKSSGSVYFQVSELGSVRFLSLQPVLKPFIFSSWFLEMI